MQKDELKCMIDSEIFEKLTLALRLNKEHLNDVLEKLLTDYISESFLKAAKNMSSTTLVQNTSSIDSDGDYGKANRKIPVWARRSNQNNHKIIKAYFLIENEEEEVTYEKLRERCSNQEQYLDTYVSDFKGNFAQMKTDASNSHGKVFVLNDDKVEIWDEIFKTMMEYKSDFLVNEGGGEKVKITDEMVHGAYEIAKMVYDGQISRNEGKYKIIQDTNMSAGSAGDYIANFLYMMNGQKYTRVLSSYATKYYLESIRKDFGEKQFDLALEAVKKHIKYYNSLPYGKLNKIQAIVEELSI